MMVSRSKIIFLLVSILNLAVIARLFYWQVIESDQLVIQAQQQTQKSKTLSADRGKIYTADDSLIVGNQTYYQLQLEKAALNVNPSVMAKSLTPILLKQNYDYLQLVDPSEQETFAEQFNLDLENKLKQDKKWLILANKLTTQDKEAIEALNLAGLHFIQFTDRYYPEASMAAHLLGFVGKNESSEPTGYFGIEGALDKELAGSKKKIYYQSDALGYQLIGQDLDTNVRQGRDITLTIRRDIQYIAELELANGVERYGAKAGEVIIMEPHTGKILAQAAWPNYDPYYYPFFANANFPNPSLANLYEPGSTFKVLTVSAGIDTGAITPDTECDNCAGPVKIANYTIHTWNEQYTANISMKEALRQSDNTAMVFIAQKLGENRLSNYFRKFGIGEKLQLDLQEDSDTLFPEKIGPVELATMSFGQGISTSSYQLIRAVGAIANQGQLMKPMIIEQVYDPNTKQTIINQPQVLRQVISPQTASTVTAMMVYSAPRYKAKDNEALGVAGKTGTSQVAIEGGYADDQTIASYIAFAPAEKPKFIMLVKLLNPTASKWGDETAAPIWYNIAKKLDLLIPDR